MDSDAQDRILRRLEKLDREARRLLWELEGLKAELRHEEGAPAESARPGASLRATAATTAAAGKTTAGDPGVEARRSPLPATIFGRDLGEVADLEFWIGGRGLLLLGALALVLAVGFFLKYSIEQGWIGPTVRVLLGAAVGGVAVGVGERTRSAGHRTYGLWLSASGFSAIYLSVWAATQLYALLGPALGLSLMVVVVCAAGGLGLLRRAEAFVALAAFGGYLAPILLHVEPASAAFGLGYLAALSGAGLVVAVRADWAYLGAMAMIGGAVMTLPDVGAPDLHGVYLVLLVGGALAAARRRRWPAVAALALVFGWSVLAVSYDAWNLEALRLAGYGTALWAAGLAGTLGVVDWVPSADRPTEAARREADVLELLVTATELLAPAAFYAVAIVGVRASAFRGSSDGVALVLGLVLGAVQLAAARYARADVSRRAARAALGYAFWLVAPMFPWHGGAVARAWVIEGFVLAVLGGRLRSPAARGAALAALALAALQLAGTALQAATQDPAFISLAALTRLAIVGGLLAWALIVEATPNPRGWETGLRPIVLVFAAALFLHWGTVEIDHLFAALPQPSAHRLARDLSISGFWIVYAAALLIAGFIVNRAPIRWAGLIMALIAASKVFIYDLSQLDRLYRIGSFVLLALVLLTLSFGYQRFRREGVARVEDD